MNKKRSSVPNYHRAITALDDLINPAIDVLRKGLESKNEAHSLRCAALILSKAIPDTFLQANEYEIRNSLYHSTVKMVKGIDIYPREAVTNTIEGKEDGSAEVEEEAEEDSVEYWMRLIENNYIKKGEDVSRGAAYGLLDAMIDEEKAKGDEGKADRIDDVKIFIFRGYENIPLNIFKQALSDISEGKEELVQAYRRPRAAV